MIKRYFPLLCVAVLATGAAQAQKIAVTKGARLEMVTTMKMTMSMEMMGQNIDNNTESTNTTQVEAKDVNPNGFVFTNTIKKILVHTSAMGQEVNFDSDKKEDLDGPMGESMKGMLNVPQDVVVDKQGRVVEKKGDSAASGGMSEMMNMTNSLMKGQPYPVLATLPAGRTAKVGDSWTDSTGSPENLKTITAYTVKSLTKDEIVVDFTTRLSKKGTIEQQGMQIDLDMAGTMKGTASYEAATGLLKKNDSTSDVKGTIGVMGQSAPMTMTITTSVVTKKL